MEVSRSLTAKIEAHKELIDPFEIDRLIAEEESSVENFDPRGRRRRRRRRQ